MSSKKSATTPEMQALVQTLPDGEEMSAADAYSQLMHSHEPVAPRAPPEPAFASLTPPPPPPASGAPSVLAEIEQVQRRVRMLVEGVERERNELAARLGDTQARLGAAEAEIKNLRAEREWLMRLKGLYERKFANIRDLTQMQEREAGL